MLYAKINVKSNHFLFLTSLESPLNKGGSEGVWKYRWLPMNQAQLQILDMLSFIKTPEALRDLNKVISDYFVQMADAELDRMWNEGTLNEERIESFRHLHERTPYNKPIL